MLLAIKSHHPYRVIVDIIIKKNNNDLEQIVNRLSKDTRSKLHWNILLLYFT